MPSLRPRLRYALPAALVAAIAAGTVVALPDAEPLVLQGLSGTAVLDAEALKDAAVSVPTRGRPTRVLVDGRVLAAGRSGTVVASLAGLSDGVHTVRAVVDWGFPRGTASAEHRVQVDTLPPALALDPLPSRARIKDPVTVRGRTEPGAVVTAAGGVVTQQGDRFTVAFPAPPAEAPVTASDWAGNRTTVPVTVRTRYPDNIRAVHMTGRAWAYSKLRQPVMALVQQKRINAIQLDIKDESGIVNFRTGVRLARTVGAEMSLYDARKTTAALHRQGVRVIGRVVAFNDPKLADWAEARGRRDWLVQNPDGSKYLYGYNRSGFTNFAQKAVRDYNVAIAEAAIRAGFDDVVFDYVRRPDGPIATMRFPGLRGAPEDAIVTFLREARSRIRPLGGSLGAAAFAQAATRPKATAQNIRKMARYLDVVIPMDYPSHWNPGEYGVPDPYAGAYWIVRRSLVDWRKQVQGTDCVVVPWLQDEDFRGDYTPAKVMEQIRGTRDNGIPGWLMWSAAARYQGAAYSPDATPAL